MKMWVKHIGRFLPFLNVQKVVENHFRTERPSVKTSVIDISTTSTSLVTDIRIEVSKTQLLFNLVSLCMESNTRHLIEETSIWQMPWQRKEVFSTPNKFLHSNLLAEQIPRIYIQIFPKRKLVMRCITVSCHVIKFIGNIKLAYLTNFYMFRL